MHADLATGTVEVSGEVDYATAPQIMVISAWLLATGDQDVTLSLRGVTFADCALVETLEELQRAAQTAGRRLRLVDLTPPVERLLDLAADADLLLLCDATTAS